MLPLAELQRGFSHAVLAGDAAGVKIAMGRVSPTAALQVHRNTIIGALVNALRLTYPSVDALVGEAFFDQAAAAFAELNPPATARLAGYGEGFADFLAAHVPSLPYLPDVARLDRAVDRALSCTATTWRTALDGCVALEWPVSLVLLSLSWPADAIKAALGDDIALQGIDMAPSPRWLLVWRSGRHAMTRAISAPAAAFMEAMLSQRGSGKALAAATALSADAPAIIQGEIFTASFCTVISGEPS
jgi:hypothetical protein